MAKSVIDAMLDAALSYLANNSTRLAVCSAIPASYAEATTTYDGGAGKYCLALKTITSADFTGPADGDSNGRKITVNQQAGLSVLATATAVYVVLCDSSVGIILVTTCTSQALTLGNTVTVPAFKDEIADPT